MLRTEIQREILKLRHRPDKSLSPEGLSESRISGVYRLSSRMVFGTSVRGSILTGLINDSALLFVVFHFDIAAQGEILAERDDR